MDASKAAQLAPEHRFDNIAFRPAQSNASAWRYWLLLGVLALHIWLGWVLAGFHPKLKDRIVFPAPSLSLNDDVVVLNFPVQDSKPGRNLQAATASLTARNSRSKEVKRSAAGERKIGPAPPPALILTLKADQPIFGAPKSPLDHIALLEYHETQFEQAWVSDGTLTDVLASRSRLASFLLGGTGALRKPCTEEQKSRYDIRCVPAQYRHPDPNEGKLTR